MNSDDFEWCEFLSLYELSEYKDGIRTYRELVDMIRTAADGAFNICDSAWCRHRNAIRPVKEVSWDYLYQCMKISGKDFQINLPSSVAYLFLKNIIDTRNKEYVYAWYDPETEGVSVLAYTGNQKEEEIIYPEYDGFGRLDISHDVVEGVLDSTGKKWIKKPRTYFV